MGIFINIELLPRLSTLNSIERWSNYSYHNVFELLVTFLSAILITLLLVLLLSLHLGLAVVTIEVFFDLLDNFKVEISMIHVLNTLAQWDLLFLSDNNQLLHHRDKNVGIEASVVHLTLSERVELPVRHLLTFAQILTKDSLAHFSQSSLYSCAYSAEIGLGIHKVFDILEEG